MSDYIILPIILIGIVAWVIYKRQQERRQALLKQTEEKQRSERQSEKQMLMDKMSETGKKLNTLIKHNYFIQPCFKCYESSLKLLEISPNGRSAHYQCIHCGRKMRAAAGSPNTTDSLTIWNNLLELVEQYNRIIYPEHIEGIEIQFETTPSILPYERTSRTAIPEIIRSEVWRRDGGCCANCGSKENLQFDHIIPVSRGGSTSAQNLQILCQQYNLNKGTNL